MLKLVKVISDKTYSSKSGMLKNVNYFALEFDNGRRIPIQPIYDDYDILNFQCEKVIDLRKDK